DPLLTKEGDRERLSQLQLLTLCSMQQRLESDVALLQKRDFFSELPKDTKDIGINLAAGPDPQLQQILDRIVWKGDLLTLLYVPGSALKKALEQSKIFDAEDASELSLAAEKQRGLVKLGIQFDPDHNEYLINGV